MLSFLLDYEAGGQLSVEEQKGMQLCTDFLWSRFEIPTMKNGVNLMRGTDKLSLSAEGSGKVSCGFEVMPVHEIV